MLTLTVNPTIDLNAQVEQVVAERKLRCRQPRREPGGGGINVSRALQRLGGESTALYLAGGPTGEMLRQLLGAEGVRQRVIPLEGWARENVIVFEERSGQQYRFGMPGPEVREPEWRYCLAEVAASDPTPAYLVVSGSMVPGMPADFFAHLTRTAKELGARLVVDTSGEALRRAAEAGAYLLKPNLREFRALVGSELTDEREQEAAGRRLIEQGACEVILLSLGAGGARLITAAGSEHIRTPTVPIRSKVGAGDSSVAGMVLGLARGLEVREAARFGVAAGAAAVMTEGTELCRREDAERLYAHLRAEMAAR